MVWERLGGSKSFVECKSGFFFGIRECFLKCKSGLDVKRVLEVFRSFLGDLRVFLQEFKTGLQELEFFGESKSVCGS